MKIGGSTVLVTGGATGIGFALAQRLARAGSQVVVCGRREEALRAAKQKVPELETLVVDVGREADRAALAAQVVERFPRLNVLVNNAGIQRRARFADDAAPWSERREEIAINFEAPVHLTALLLPHLRKQPDAAVVNVSSGLAFVPAVFAPVYCATKAALHSFSVSLRHELERASVEVIEIVPPAVDTDLGGRGLHNFGVPLGEFTDAVMAALERGEREIGFGFSDQARNASRTELDAMAERMAK
jgi:uncharacterized oxidoreductase